MTHEVDNGSTRVFSDDLRDKYRVERDKRLATGDRKYVDLDSGDLARYLDDPYTEFVDREPLYECSDVLVVGAGLGGLMIGAALRSRGVKDIRMVDSAGGVGGTWYWNRYPGISCDCEAHVYVPMLDEVGEVPRYKYAPGPEIQRQAQAIADGYDLSEHILFHTTVVDMVWDAEDRRWVIRTDRGDEFRARFAILANGTIQKPKIPAIPGVDSFQGASFHTSRWDFSVTGGSATEDPTKLADKVVGIIGTGATAIQAVPPLGRSAKELFVFQRTPSAVLPRNNGPVPSEWIESLQTGWQAKRRRDFMLYTNGKPGTQVELDELNPLDDGFTKSLRILVTNPAFASMNEDELAVATQQADLQLMEMARDRIDEIIDDPATAEALKPWFGYLCKRPTFHDEYLPTFNRHNVHLVDTLGRGVESITPRGVMVNGQEYPLDVLIFSTGFENSSTRYTERIGFDVIGIDGISLAEKWAGGLRTLHGMLSAGFPNMCFQATPGFGQAATTWSYTELARRNADIMGALVAFALEREVLEFDVDQEAEDAWVQTILDTRIDFSEYFNACTPGRFNNDGRLDLVPVVNTDFGGGPFAFYRMMDTWERSGYPGLSFVPAPAS